MRGFNRAYACVRFYHAIPLPLCLVYTKTTTIKKTELLSNIFMRTVLTAAVFRIDTYKIWRL